MFAHPNCLSQAVAVLARRWQNIKTMSMSVCISVTYRGTLTHGHALKTQRGGYINLKSRDTMEGGNRHLPR